VTNETLVKLSELFRILPFVLPIEFVLGEFVAYVRAIGNQKKFIMFQVICLYGIHFAMFFILLYFTTLEGRGIVINLAITYACMCIFTGIITFTTDWKIVSHELRKDFLQKKQEVEIILSKSQLPTDKTANVSKILENDTAIELTAQVSK